MFSLKFIASPRFNCNFLLDNFIHYFDQLKKLLEQCNIICINSYYTIDNVLLIDNLKPPK